MTALVAPALAGAARVALGLLWIAEGALKLQAGFGRADILLVADGAAGNTRVPEYFRLFASGVMAPLAGMLGVAIPLLELGLGLLLTLGLLTRIAALASLATLLLYWSADQLIAQYPVMAALSVVVVAFPAAARRFGLARGVAWMRERRGGGRGAAWTETWL